MCMTSCIILECSPLCRSTFWFSFIIPDSDSYHWTASPGRYATTGLSLLLHSADLVEVDLFGIIRHHSPSPQ